MDRKTKSGYMTFTRNMLKNKRKLFYVKRWEGRQINTNQPWEKWGFRGKAYLETKAFTIHYEKQPFPRKEHNSNVVHTSEYNCKIYKVKIDGLTM